MTEKEWASIPTIAPYTWECSHDGVILRAELIPGSAEREAILWPLPPFKLIARPQRDGLPVVEVDIDHGMVPLWLHRRRQAMNVNESGQVQSKTFEYVLLGRRMPDATQQIWAIYPDGKIARFSSLAEALE